MNDITEVEVAKMAKRDLQKAFPGVKFYARTSKYAGGSSIDVSWTDGPTTKQAEEIAGKYHGATFDGMTDMKEYNGAPYANDFIFFRRDYSMRNTESLLRDINLCNGYKPTLAECVKGAVRSLRGYAYIDLTWRVSIDETEADIDTRKSGMTFLLGCIKTGFEQLGYEAKYNTEFGALAIRKGAI